jgi:Fur family transcriptional regulator, ferric uptake regulator
MEEQSLTEKNIDIVKQVLRDYLLQKGYRNTPERYAIIEEIYKLEKHFNVDDLYFLMIHKKYQVSKATIYNTIDIFLDAKLIRKNQFGDRNGMAFYEKSYFDKQHDHLIIFKDENDVEIDEIVEFCDPRIQAIRQSIAEVFDVDIHGHALYFYARRKNEQ